MGGQWGTDPAPSQVYSASNVELVTKTRTEHLSDQDKSRSKGDSGGQSGRAAASPAANQGARLR